MNHSSTLASQSSQSGLGDPTITAPYWQIRRGRLSLVRPQVMAIVNVTPDSFSTGRDRVYIDEARKACDEAVAQGADVLDIGGESTRPGAQRPSPQEELDRVMPVVEHALSLDVPVSVDTSCLEVMRATVDAGVDIINDVRALSEPGACAFAASVTALGVCLMHMQGDPSTMQTAPHYEDVVGEVASFLDGRRQQAIALGMDPACIVLDPGFGFGKTVAHNQTLARGLPQLLALGSPLLVGWSRKSTLGVLTGRPVDQRQAASVAAAVVSVEAGARVVRVHDVAATVDALKVWAGLRPLT